MVLNIHVLSKEGPLAHHPQVAGICALADRHREELLHAAVVVEAVKSDVDEAEVCLQI